MPWRTLLDAAIVEKATDSTKKCAEAAMSIMQGMCDVECAVKLFNGLSNQYQNSMDSRCGGDAQALHHIHDSLDVNQKDRIFLKIFQSNERLTQKLVQINPKIKKILTKL